MYYEFNREWSGVVIELKCIELLEVGNIWFVLGFGEEDVFFILLVEDLGI